MVTLSGGSRVWADLDKVLYTAGQTIPSHRQSVKTTQNMHAEKKTITGLHKFGGSCTHTCLLEFKTRPEIENSSNLQ